MKVKLIAPSSKSSDMVEIIENAKKFYANENIDLIFSHDIFDNEELPFFAASNEIRIRDLIESFSSREYKIIWAVRGGYGSGNILDSLYQNKDIIDHKKILIGFSDITALHILLNQYLDMPSIHGPVLNSFFRNSLSFSVFKDFFAKKYHSYKITKINDIIPFEESSVLMGGNLTVITTLIGTKFSPNFHGKIILLEDVDEKGYQIHRHLMHLKDAQLFEGALAVIFGDFSKTDDIAENAIIHFCNNEINIPAYRIKDIGHGQINNPIIFGSEALIEKDILTISNPWYAQELRIDS